MSVNYIDRLRESFDKNALYARGTYQAYHSLMDDICKLSDFFYDLNKTVGIPWHEEHTGNTERTFSVMTERLHLSVFCTPNSYPALSLHARIYNKASGLNESEHVLETTDVNAMLSYLYIIICSVYPERGEEWIKINTIKA